MTRSVGLGVTLGALTFSASSVGSSRELPRPVPHVVAVDGLPAPRGRRRQRAHGLEGSRRGVDGNGLQRRLDPNPLLRDRRTGRVGVERLLLDRVQAGRHVVDAVGGQQPPGILGEPLDLVGRRDRERVDPVVRHPAGVGVHRFGRQLDRLGVERCQRPCHRNRTPGGLGRDVGIELGVRCEAPGAVDDHPHRQPDLAVDDGGLQPTVAKLHDLVDDTVDAQVGVARRRPPRPPRVQRRQSVGAAARGSRDRLDGVLSRLTP